MYRTFTSLPLVWIDENSMQIGSEDPVYVDGLSAADVELINRLRLGLGTAELDAAVSRAGMDADRAAMLLGLLDQAGALVPAESAPGDPAGQHVQALAAATGHDPAALDRELAATRIDIVGPLAESLAPVLRRAGLDAHALSGEPTGPNREQVVVLTSFLAADLLSAAALVEQDIAHLHVVFGEASTRIGHIIRAGRTPCSGCLVETAMDSDDSWFESWRALRTSSWRADQLDPVLHDLGAAHLAGHLRAALLGLKPADTGLRLSLPLGQAEDVTVGFSPSCPCRIPLAVPTRPPAG